MIQRDIKELKKEKIISEQIIESYKTNIFNEISEIENIDDVVKLKKTKNSLWKSFINMFK